MTEIIGELVVELMIPGAVAMILGETTIEMELVKRAIGMFQ